MSSFLQAGMSYRTYLRAFEPRSEVSLRRDLGESLIAVLPMVRKKAWYAGVPVTNFCGAANVHSVRYGMVHSKCASRQRCRRSHMASNQAKRWVARS